MQPKTNIGIIGCGQISSVYLEAPRTFDILSVAACADIAMERAQAQAQRFGVPRACSVEELLADQQIEIVVNLTIPKAHAKVSEAILQAGKAVYSEKPLAIDRAQGQALLDTAHARELRIGCAPDTFLGGGIQTCIQLINEGQIGTPVAATAFMMNHGPEHWHLDPDFYYQPGAGPMFDMGPYYLTALIAMLGPVRRVTGSTHMASSERTITSQLKYGTKIIVNTPTHVAGVIDFVSGAVGTIITSFDIWSHRLPRIEVYGTEGTLSVPDPNTFGGPVYLRRAHEKEWSEITLSHGYTKNYRGIGVADMAYAMRSGRSHRANGEMAYHVLDIMQAFHDASKEGRHIELTSQCNRPTPLRPGTHTWEEDC
ncbi:MAG TPA: Gfo/Idh/MocA family oxidoreductase [Ktedonosporobacter sp.]|jgi:predicted dehydrogenase|nr:Gfo/Idh/MocA family oxidoreductase [Ktedonosporobacter sp.]